MDSDELARIQQALDKVGASPVCEVCGHDHWTRVPDPGFIPLDPAPKALPVIGRVCNNCGLLRLHVAPVLLGEVPL